MVPQIASNPPNNFINSDGIPASRWAVIVNCRNIIEEGKPIFKLGGSLVVHFSSRSDKMLNRYTRCDAYDIPLEGHRGEGGKAGANICTLVRRTISACRPCFSYSRRSVYYQSSDHLNTDRVLPQKALRRT